jgi:uncharacterized membrane protein
MIKEASMSSQSGGGPRRSSVIGTLLMLPIGLIVALILLYFIGFGGRYFPGEFLVILVVIFLGLFVVRMLFWRSRREHWRGQHRGNEAIRILRARYARGEITQEQFDQTLHDLRQQP